MTICIRRSLASVAAALLASACYNAIDVIPSLTPLDASQPMVRYKPIQGSACKSVVLHMFPTGGDPLVEAIWEMRKYTDVDNYVEVTVESQTYFWLLGTTTCVYVTGYPVTYGAEPRDPRRAVETPFDSGGYTPPDSGPPPSPGPGPVTPGPGPRVPPDTGYTGGPTPAPVPVPTPPTGPSAQECSLACERFGRLAGSTPIIQRVVMEKCAERCGSGDTAYYDCVMRAMSAAAVKMCNAM